MAQVTQKGLRLVQRWESLRLVAYLDVVGVWTIGWGHTGPEVVANLTITRERADEILRADLARFERGVQVRLTRVANPPQFDAMVSLAFNVGLGGFEKSTVRRKFNAGDTDGAAEAFILFIKAKGKIWQGLANRRASEIVRFLAES